MNSLNKLSKELPFIKELEKLKKEVDSHRPFQKDLENKIFQKLRLDWNYHSNAIEGNSFTRGETVSLIMEGITAKGKPLKDALDIKGHNQAIDFMLSLVKEDRDISESDIRALHKLVLGEDFFNPAETEDGKPTRKLITPGKYKTEPNHVKTPTGEIHYYATPEETPAKMEQLVDWLNEASKDPKINAVVLASIFHHKFVEIHPFDDGNGRMTRLLTNFILVRFGYPVSVIKQQNRGEYYAALSQADNGEVIPIIELISNSVKNSFYTMLMAINGEDISEENDLDREIELFLKSFDEKDFLKEEKSDDALVVLFNDFFIPFIDSLVSKSKKIDELFFKNEKRLFLGSSNQPFNLEQNKLVIGFDKAEGSYKEEGDLHFLTTDEFYDDIIEKEKDVSDYGSFLIDMDKMDISLLWNGFLKNKKQNDLHCRVDFNFGKYKYEIKGDFSVEPLLSKYYHEKPSKHESDLLVGKIIKNGIIEKISGWS